MSFNTANHSWSQCDIAINGKILTGIRGISYDTEQSKEHIYGKGNEPLGIGRGNKKYEGELKLLKYELDALVANSPLGDLMRLKFDVTISYANDQGAIVRDTIQGCEFTKITKAVNQDDKMVELTLPIIALRIQNNV